MRNYTGPEDKRNDMRLLTPLLVMALIVVGGLLYYAIEAQAFSG